MTGRHVAYPPESGPIEFGAGAVLGALGGGARRSPADDDGAAVRIGTGAVGTADAGSLDGSGETGAMYGALEAAEGIRPEGLDGAEPSFRAPKSDLPWSPCRGGERTGLHLDGCRDRPFRSAFLDAMARNRFDARTP